MIGRAKERNTNKRKRGTMRKVERGVGARCLARGRLERAPRGRSAKQRSSPAFSLLIAMILILFVGHLLPTARKLRDRRFGEKEELNSGRARGGGGSRSNSSGGGGEGHQHDAMDQDETANDSTSDDVGGGVARRMSDSGEESAAMTRTSITVAVCQQRASALRAVSEVKGGLAQVGGVPAPRPGFLWSAIPITFRLERSSLRWTLGYGTY